LNPRTYSPLGLNNQSWIVKAVIATSGCVGCIVVVCVILGLWGLVIGFMWILKTYYGR